MAVTIRKTIWYSAKNGTPPSIRTYPIEASQGLLMPGAPVLLNADGQVALAATNSATLLGYLVGAVKNTRWPLEVELDENDKVRVAIVRARDVYVVQYDVANNDGAVSQALVGTSEGYRVQTAAPNRGYVTMTSSGLNRLVIVDLMANVEPHKHSVSDVPGYALVKHTMTLQG